MDIINSAMNKASKTINLHIAKEQDVIHYQLSEVENMVSILLKN